MKTYNQVIQVEVQVQHVANMLAGIIKDDYAHKDLVVETTIDSALPIPGAISGLYHSLMGFVTTVNFKQNDKVTNGDDIVRTVEEIDMSRADGKYIKLRSTMNKDSEWVNHINLKAA